MDFEPIVAARLLPIERRDGNLDCAAGIEHSVRQCADGLHRGCVSRWTCTRSLKGATELPVSNPGGLSHSQTELAAHAAVIPFGPAAPLRRPDPADQARCRPLTQFPKIPLLAYHYRLKQQQQPY
jgi:hypothetical protein